MERSPLSHVMAKFSLMVHVVLKANDERFVMGESKRLFSNKCKGGCVNCDFVTSLRSWLIRIPTSERNIVNREGTVCVCVCVELPRPAKGEPWSLGERNTCRSERTKHRIRKWKAEPVNQKESVRESIQAARWTVEPEVNQEETSNLRDEPLTPIHEPTKVSIVVNR